MATTKPKSFHARGIRSNSATRSEISFRLAFNGAANPTLLEGCTGWVKSAVYSGTGVITITLEDAYPGWAAIIPTCQFHTPTKIIAQLGSVDLVTAKTIVIQLLDDALAAVAPPAANANDTLSVVILLRESKDVTP